jgi:F0F1-type ATP synthase assembly protein I
MSSNKRPSSPGADMARGASEAARWLAVPIGLVVWVSVFWLTGRWVDGRWDTDPWAQLVGAIVGFAVGFTYVFWAVRVAMQDPNENKKVEGDQR